MQKKSAAGGITNQWYNSEMGNWAFYGQENPPDGMDIQLYGHFTQVVWKDSTKVGCATVKCPAGSVLQYPSWYTVCNYNPQGKSYTLGPLQIQKLTVYLRQLWRPLRRQRPPAQG